MALTRVAARWAAVVALALGSVACIDTSPVEVVLGAEVESRIEGGALVLVVELENRSAVDVVLADAPAPEASAGPVGLIGSEASLALLTGGELSWDTADLDQGEDGTWHLAAEQTATVDLTWATDATDEQVADARCAGELEVLVRFGARAADLSELVIDLCRDPGT